MFDVDRAALQYSNTPGLAELLTRIKNIQRFVHRPPGAAADFDVAVSTGSQVRLLGALRVACRVLGDEGCRV